MIPDLQTIMLPLLELAADEKEHSIHEAIEKIANHFSLSEEDRNQMISTGKQTVLSVRVSWARTYLKEAGLLVNPRRGFFQITHRGLEVLDEKPERISKKLLRRYKEFTDFVQRSRWEEDED